MLLSLPGGKATIRDAFGDAKDCENDRANAEHTAQFHFGIVHTAQVLQEYGSTRILRINQEEYQSPLKPPCEVLLNLESADLRMLRPTTRQ